MRFRSSVLALAGAILGLGLPLLSPFAAASPAAPVATTPVATTPAATTPAATTARHEGSPRLTTVRARHLGDVDRVRFRFRGGLPQSMRVNWVETMHRDESGRPVRVAGTKVLMVVFFGLHPDHGSTARTRTAYALPNVITSVNGGDTGGRVTFGLGVQKRTSFTVTMLENPDRVVIDVAAGFPTTTRDVWLSDRNAVATGAGPSFVPRPRPIRSDAPATATLHALFAGPLPQEQAAGLRLVRSRAWGFDDLRLAGHIARVELTRGCDSGGSTITVAGEVAPTLRQFSTVDWVKIYGPDGSTEQPQGRTDSIPACLEP